MKTDNIKSFRTSDMPLIAFLRINNCVVKGVHRKNANQAEFEFESVPRSLLNDYNLDKCVVEPKMYATIMRQMTKSARNALIE